MSYIADMTLQRLTASFARVLALFERHDVSFLVVGSYASSALSQPRYVKDLDLLLERSKSNATRTLAALDDFGFAQLGLSIEDFTSDTVIELGYAPVLVDLQSTGFHRRSTKPFSFADEHARRIEVQVDGTTFPLAHPEYQIEIKRLCNRRHDLADVAALEQGDPLHRTVEDRIREIERLRRLDLDAGDPDRPIARAVRRKRIHRTRE